MNLEQAKATFGLETESFLNHLNLEIPSFFRAGVGLLREYECFRALCSQLQFGAPPTETLVGTVSYCLLLKQFELIGAAIRSLLSHEYIVCATLLRSIFEANMILMHLDHHPEDASDFVTFSEVSCNVDFDWAARGISRTKRDTLEKKFGIRKLIKDLYTGTENDQQRIHQDRFYQQLCNATHPSLESATFFYRYGSPPTREYSSTGVRRTVIQLRGVTNSAVEHLSGAIYRNGRLLEECYARRGEMYTCHYEATAWHAQNPQATPTFTRNEEFRIVWNGDRAVVSCVRGDA